MILFSFPGFTSHYLQQSAAPRPPPSHNQPHRLKHLPMSSSFHGVIQWFLQELIGMGRGERKFRKRENKYAPAYTVDSMGKNATVSFFKQRKEASSLPWKMKEFFCHMRWSWAGFQVIYNAPAPIRGNWGKKYELLHLLCLGYLPLFMGNKSKFRLIDLY